MAPSWRPPLKVQFTTTRDEGKLTGVYGTGSSWRGKTGSHPSARSSPVREWVLCVPGGSPLFISLASENELHGSSRTTRNDRGRRRARSPWLARMPVPSTRGITGDEVHEDCLKACESCERTCNETFHHCYTKVAEGKKEHAKALHLVAELRQVLRLVGRPDREPEPAHGPRLPGVRRGVQGVRAECDRFDSAEMKSCVKACRECETTCRAMVKAMGHDHHG